MSVLSLLGETLRKPDGSTVPAKDALSGKSVLALYFSAHWCGPCRGFTPVLAEKYKGLVDAGKDVEFVFVSSDKDESAFGEYHSSMPFLALPFVERDAKAKLSKMFKVQGIPTLVFYDIANAKLITTDGREAVSSDDYIKEYPYKPEVFSMGMLGTKFRLPDGKEGSAELLAKEVIGLYFSAHWCPPCKAFTPQLSENYTALVKAGKSFELFFVSSDKDDEAFTEYHNSMSFPALPFADRAAKDKLSKVFKVQGIPTLVFVDTKTGKVITDSGRGAISSPSFIEDFPYHPKSVYDLGESTDGVNDEVCLVVLMEGAPPKLQAELTKALLSVAEEELKKPEADQLASKFFTAKEKGGLGDKVRTMCGYPAPTPEPVMLVMDFGDEGAHYHPLAEHATAGADNMRATLAAFKAGKLTKKTASG